MAKTVSGQDPQDPQDPMVAIQRLARAGQWAAAAALLLLVVVVVVMASHMLRGTLQGQLAVADLLALEDDGARLSPDQTRVALLFWIVSDLVGALLLVSIWQLFGGIRRVGVFTPQAGRTLRRIGILLLILPVAGMLAQTLGHLVIMAWQEAGRVAVLVSLEDTDIYALVIGLVIVLVGHIMTLATQISDENRAFV